MYKVAYSNDPNAKFNDFFKLQYRRMISSGSYLLNWDVCSFVPDGELVVLAATSSALHRPNRHEEAPSPSFSPYSLSGDTASLDDYALYLVHVATGRVSDVLVLGKDLITFSPPMTGISFNGVDLCITSLHHQLISVVHVDVKERIFRPGLRLGCAQALRGNLALPPDIPNLKQKLIATLYLEAVESDRRSEAVCHFHSHLHVYQSLAIWNAQLVRPNMLLTIFAPAGPIILRQLDHPFTTVVFAFIDVESQSIVRLFSDASVWVCSMFAPLYDGLGHFFFYHQKFRLHTWPLRSTSSQLSPPISPHWK